MNARASVLAALLLLPTAAFAGRGDAELALTAARSNVAAAERAGAPQQAPVEYRTAAGMLARAEGSYIDRDWDDVVLEAERAKADARLAESRARALRAEATLAELEATIESLRAELARGGA